MAKCVLHHLCTFAEIPSFWLQQMVTDSNRKQNVVTEIINFAYQTQQDPTDKGPVMLWQFTCMEHASCWVSSTLSILFYLHHLLWVALIASEMFLVYLVATCFIGLVLWLAHL